MDLFRITINGLEQIATQHPEWYSTIETAIEYLKGRDTDHRMVCVEDVLETVRDMAHHPDHVFIARDLLEELERRLMK